MKSKVATAFSILLIVISLGAVFSERTQNKLVTFGSKNKTSAIQVANIRTSDGFAMVTLKNVSTKNVNAIHLSFNRGSIRIEFLDADEPDGQKLIPGANYDQIIPLQNPSELLEVNVLAAAFDDNSGDGDPKLVKEIFDMRRGYNKELKRITPLLEAALASPDEDSPILIEKLKSQFEALPVQRKNESSAFRQGETAARQDFLYDLQVINQLKDKIGTVQIRRALGKTKNRYAKRIEQTPDL
jgi:hypothetical protein